jgi:uncharacterized protein (UPF0333 family)
VLAPNQVSRAFALVVVFALLAAGCGSSGTLSASALSKESTSMQSLAAEGALLARDSAAGRTTHIYTRVHSEDLYKVASKSAKSLQSAKTKPGLESRLRKVASLSSKVSADLKRLGHASKAEQSRLAGELESSAKELG